MRERVFCLLLPCLAAAQGVITTVAGADPAFPGFATLAPAAPLGRITAVIADKSGNYYFSDGDYHVVIKASATGAMTVVAGTGLAGFSNDGGAGPTAMLHTPMGLALDGAGNLYIADTGNSRVRVVSNGIISTFAGSSTTGYFGDGGLAIAASLNAPTALAVDGAGNPYIADSGKLRIRKVANGLIKTIAGNGAVGAGD